MKQAGIFLGLSVFVLTSVLNSEGYKITVPDDPLLSSEKSEEAWNHFPLEDDFTYYDLSNPSTTTTSTTPITRPWKYLRGDPPTTPQTSTTPGTTTTTSSTTPSPVADCEISKVVVYHFPGPCRAAITCKNGSQFTVDQCLNTLTFISQFKPNA